MIQRENNCAGTSSGCGSQSCLRLTVGIGNEGRFGRRGWLDCNGSRVSGDARLRLFLDTNQALIGNLPAEVAVLAALFEILLEKNGTAGIGDENAGSGQKNIPSAILHFHTTTEKG